MKKNIWTLLFFIGVCPFVIPVAMSVTKSSSWTFFDWMVLWSYVYWPTYIVGAILIALSVYNIRKSR